MKRSYIYLSALVLSICFAQGASADNNQDTVNSGAADKKIVTNTFGSCVRTKWQSESDPCAPPPPPKPVVAAPPPAPAPRIEADKRTVYFDFDKASLTGAGSTTLDNLVSLIKANGQITRMTVVGYTDVLGSDSYNDKLSQKRANNVQTYLAGKLNIPSNTTVRGLGKSRTASCDGLKKRSKKQKECLAPDRRVEVELNYVR